MKIIHTPLGTLVSKKKLIAGAAALALVGSIAPTLINNTHAEEIYPEYDPDETIFTTVGPDYYTYIQPALGDYYYLGYTLTVADTSVADFISGCNAYSCLQGKKVGATEIIAAKNGIEEKRFPVVSVELTPEAKSIHKWNDVVTETGSIVGANNSLLAIQNIIDSGWAAGEQTGERSYKVHTEEDEYDDHDAWGNSLTIQWTIGNQKVYGGTEYEFLPVEGIDNVYHLPENEEILEDSVLNVLKLIEKSWWELSAGDKITTEDGSTFHFTNTSNHNDYDGRLRKTQGMLDFSDENITQSAKDKLTAVLPEGAEDVKFKNITATARYYFQQYSGGGSTSRGNGNYNSEIFGYFDSLSEPLTMAIDVSDVNEVAEGYTRTWYVVRDNDGEIEKLEADFDEDTNTIRFDTKVFGLHAYGYIDEKIGGEEEEGESTPAPAVPNTGSPIQKVAKTAAITFAPLAAIAFGAFAVRNRKKAANKLAKKHNHFE